MKDSRAKSSRKHRDRWIWAGCLLVAAALAVPAFAQDYRSFQSTNERTGRASIQPTTVDPETTWNNAGRGFLRWFDPVVEDGAFIDNPDPGASVSFGAWGNPFPIIAGGTFILASGYYADTFNEPPYLFAVTSTTGGVAGPDPSIGATSAFQWNLTGLTLGSQYTIEVQVPAGPTNITPNGPIDLRFTPHYQLYSVTSNSGTEFYWLDLFESAGGMATLADGRIFEASATGNIIVRLYNVVRRNDFGTQVDPLDQPGTDVVYADAVQATSRSAQGTASTSASPVVGRLLQPSIAGGPTQFPQRVVSTRNEDVFFGSINKQMRFGVVTSFTHNGTLANVGQPLRRNMVWSWPAVRPLDLSQSEEERYAVDRQNWLMGAPNSNYPRYEIFRQADNLSSGTNIGAGFADDTVFSHIGPNYVTSPAVPAATSFVEWAPVAKEGRYFISVYFPTDDTPADLATTVTYQILQGGTVIATRTVNQSELSGWRRLENQPEDGYEHTNAFPLTVRILNSGSAQDVADGRNVYADAIRFIGDADLAITSTPVQTVATVQYGGAPRLSDVVLVARENGSLSLMDAHGNVAAASQDTVFWTWPSEDPTTDPNWAPTEDYGIAETPIGFNLSSALIANIGGEDLIFIGSQDGRVYCLEARGRGDGTTRRRWTWPDDFDPTNPTAPLTPTNIGPINGSLALANLGGTPAIIVPDSNGRVYAIDAAGDAATRTTTQIWQYPPAASAPIDPVNMTPVVAFGRITFAAGDTIYSLVEDGGVAGDANVSWTRTTRLDGTTPFDPDSFDTSSPVAVNAPIVPTDSLYFVDRGGYITSVNAATGAVQWEERSVPSGAIASLSFAYMRTFDATGTTILNAVPTVLVPSRSGALLGFYADGTVNVNGNRKNWGYYVESTADQVASFAVGGWPNAAGLLANRTHIYAADGDGILYAFSSEDDINGVPPYTPGRPPGSVSPQPNDVDQDELNRMIDQEDFLLVSPEQYQELLRRAQAGTLDYAYLTTLKADSVDRRHFEYGETLYIVIMNINSTTYAPTAGYYVELELDTTGRNSRPVAIPVRDVTGAPSDQQGGVAFASVALLPTGPQSVRPGLAQVLARARVGSRGGVRGNPVNLSVSAEPTQFLADIIIANPLGLRTRAKDVAASFQGAGVTTNPADPSVITNNPVGYVGPGIAAYNKYETGFTAAGPTTWFPSMVLSPTLGSYDPIPHGGSGAAAMEVYDRSLMRLILGPGRGLAGVQVASRDLVWQPVSNFTPTNAAEAGILNPIPYAGFEDIPTYPNISLDYPDLPRSGMAITKDLRGTAENPLFGGVSLIPPGYTTADYTTYQSLSGYDAGLTRTLVPTPFNLSISVPKYQPAASLSGTRSAGYASAQTIYVETGQPGLDSNDASRQFALGADIAADLHPTTETKTVDLGSIPQGGGMYDPATGQPRNPWAAFSFAPYFPSFMGANPQFQQFTVMNEGNVNLLNVRLSKQFDVINGGTRRVRPLELYSATEHELGWLDAATSLFSDLDPQLSPTRRAGLDVEGRIFLQKPRPGDPAPTRLKTNPRRRQNSNLNVNSGTLIPDVANFPDEDPYVGVTVPIGAPVGSYVRSIYAFEDALGSNSDPNVPSLGYYPLGIGFGSEPYTDPGFALKFNIRESRLTNRSTTKAANIFETVTPTDPGMDWSNRQPTVSRDANGALYMAFSSNRLDNGNVPGELPRGRSVLDAANQDAWRIYFSAMGHSGSTFGSSPLADLNGWSPPFDGDPFWFTHAGMLPVGNEWNNWFALAAGETLQAAANPTSARFLYPTFAAQGFINPLEPADPSRPTYADRYMAFVGETTKLDRSGQPQRLSQVMLADLHFEDVVTRNSTGALNGIFPVPDDPTSQKGRPSLVQNGRNAAVFYTAQAAGRSELYNVNFDGTTFAPARGLGLASVFEELSAPTALLRAQSAATPGSTGAAIDVFFTGQVRGRQNAEGFTGQLQVQPNGLPAADATWRIFEDRFDRLDYDASTGVFWTPGVHWAIGPADVDAFQLLILNPATGALDSLIRNDTANPADMRSRIVDRETREMVFEGTRGGKVYVDARRGSVRFSGTILGRAAQIFAVYSPRFVRVSGNQGAFNVGDVSGGRIARTSASTGGNYRGAAAAFDDRYLGVYLDGFLAERALTEDANFWYTPSGAALAPPYQVRQDRFYVAFNRTSGDGAASARPVMTSLRFGINLPTPVAINPNTGLPVSITVSSSAATPLAYQIDPVSGRLFVPSEHEGATITIRYTGVDVNGNLITNINRQEIVGIIPEMPEQAVPIEQVGNEGDLFISLDRVAPNNPFVDQRRPPLLWLVWSSARTGAPDVYFETYAPKTAPSLRRP